MFFGKNFKKARDRLGIPQTDAAALLEISPSFLSQIESNKKKPSVDLILKAAKVYNVDPGFFFHNPEGIDLESLNADKNKEFKDDLGKMPVEDLRNKYDIKFNGEELTDAELKGIIAYLTSLRNL